jgi:hypothetical protein
MRPLSRTAKAGAKLEIWLENLFQDLEYNNVQRNVHYHFQKNYIYRQVDLEYKTSILKKTIMIEAKYSKNCKIRYKLRNPKNKAGQKIKIDNLLDEVEERRLFVQAKKAILITNKEFEKKVYQAVNNYSRIEIYDLEQLRELDKKRTPFWRKRKTIDEQIKSINLKQYPLEPTHRWVKK